MATNVYLMLSALLSVAVLTALLRRRRDILQNPKKYAEIPGWDSYRSSMWYERKYERYGRHYYASLVTQIPGMLLFYAGYMAVGTLIQKHLLIPQGTLFLGNGNLFIGGIAAVFFWIGFGDYLCFRSKSPLLIAARLYAHSGEKHEAAWRTTVTRLTVLSVLCLPVMLYAVTGWSCADDRALIFRGLLPCRQQEYRYADIVSSRTDWSASKGNTEFSFDYELTMADGTVLELCDRIGDGDAARLHERLQAAGVPFTPCVLEPEIYALMCQHCGREELALVNAAFRIPVA